MHNCLQKIKTLFSQKHRKLLVSFAAFMMICVGAQAANITWTGNASNDWDTSTNWTPASVPGTNDTVIFNGAATVTVSGDITINNLHILSETETVTLDFSGATDNHLTIKTRLRLGQGPTGNLVLINAEVTTKEFDTNDNGTNSLKLNDTTLTLTGKLLKNGTGTTTISADSPATGQFIVTDTVDIPDHYNNEVFEGVTLVFGSGVTVNSPKTIWTGRTDSNWNDNSNWLFGIPEDDTEVIIPKITPAPILSTASAELKNITIDTEANLTISSSGTLSTAKITNNGTITVTGGSISGTTSTPTPAFTNGESSTIIYDGATSPVWGNTYNNLEIKSGSLTFSSTDNATINKDLKISADFTNNANLSVKGKIESTADMTGSGNLIFTGTADQVFDAGNNQYSNIQENKTGTGTLTINGNCEIASFTITRGTETIFAGTPEITTFTNGSTHTGKITFNNGAAINGDFSYTTGITQITGTLTADDVQLGSSTKQVILSSGIIDAASVTLGTLSLAGTGNQITTTGTQSLSAIDGAAPLSLDSGSSSISFNANIGSTTPLSTLEVNGAATVASGCTGITTTGVQTYNNTVSINNPVKIKSDTEIDFLNTITGSQKLTVDTPVFKSASSSDNSITLDEIEFFASSTSIQTNSKKLTLNVTSLSGTNTIALSSGSELELASGITVSPAITNSGTITCAGPATFEKAYSGTGASLTLSSGITTFENDLDLSGTTLTPSSGKVQIGGTAASAVTVTGSSTSASPESFNDFTTSRSLIIKGYNSFNDFTATSLGGGKSISFEAGTTQIVNGTLSLSGTGTGSNLLTLKNEGTGTWTITCSNPSITYVDVINSTSTNEIFAIESKDSGGNNTNWIFPGMEYHWTGNTSNDWDTPSNWSPSSVPGYGATVYIEPATNHPILTGAKDLNKTYNSHDYNGTITIETNAKFDLQGNTLKVGAITNNGTVFLEGIANQIQISGGGTPSNGTSDSTVEYDGSSTTLSPATLAWGNTYKNLIINKPANLDGTALIISGTTKITPGSTYDVSLNNSGNSFTGAITINAKAVTLNSSSNITIATNASADNLSVTCADGKTINVNKITTTHSQTFDGAVTVASNSILTGGTGSGNLIHFKKTITGNKTLSIAAANSQFDGAITNLTSLTTAATTTFTANATISAVGSLSTDAANIYSASISTTGAQTYGGAVTVYANTNFSANAGQLINFQNTLTGSGSPLPQITIQNADSQFDGAISSFTSLTTAGTANFNANISSVGTLSTAAANINCSSISTSGVQTYGGAVSLAHDTALTSNSGNITFNSTLNGAHQIELSVPTTATISVTGPVGNSSSPSVVLTQAGTTTFTNAVNISSFSDTTASGAITFNGGGTISSATSFSTPQPVTFGNDASDTFNFANASGNVNLTHTAGNTNITGTLNAANITLGTADGKTTTINGTVSGADITFGITSLNGTISAAQTSIGNLQAQGNITTSGSQTYNGTVELTNDLSLESTTSTSGTGGITFTSTIDGTHVLNITTNTGTNGTTFNAPVGQTTPLSSISVTGPSAFHCTSITSTGAQTYNGTITVQSDTTLTANAGQLISFQNTLTGSGSPLPQIAIQNANSQFDGAISSFTSLTTAGTANFNANISSVGTLSTAAANINCSSISTSDAQTYGGTVSLGHDTALTSSSGNITFNSTLNGAHQIELSVPTTATISVTGPVGNSSAPSVVLTQAGTTTFTNAVNISSFSDTTASGAITFNGGGTISSATSFSTPQPVTFGNDASDTFNFANASGNLDLSHTTGNTNITGTLNAANITLGTADGKTTTINGTVSGADITVGDTTGGPVTITTTGVFLLSDGKTLSYTSSFTQNGTGNSVIKGDFGSTSGNGTASFAHSVQLNANGASSFGTSGDTISITENLIITAPAAGITLNAPVTANENIVMYTGPVTVAADLHAQKDILILGSSYSETDTSTGITDEYAYASQRPAGWSTVNYNATQLPDRNSIPASNTYSATLQTQTGKTITADKNFYANHTELTSTASGQWILKLTDLTNPENGFAEAYFTKITDCKVICNDGSEDGSKARLITLEDTDSDSEKATNLNVDFDEFKITSAYTVRDNVIRVEFNRPIRYHSSVVSLLNYHDSNDSVTSTTSFLGFYTNPDCVTDSEITTTSFPSYTNPNDGNIYYYFYIKAAPQDSAAFGAWNTDATGRNGGQEKSSDRNSVHHTALPCLDFPRALAGNGGTNTIPFIFTDIWGKRLINYSQRVPLADSAEPAYGSISSTFEVEDKTGPVLWSVRTGQELHQAYNASSGDSSQHSYDSHNFLEFRYSEKVDVGSLTAANVPAENLQVTDSLGAVLENITDSHNTMNFAGLVKLTAPAGNPLKLYTGSSGSPNKYVNALYRNDEYSVRLSIAGWTDGTITDYSGNTYKKWPGYIEAATQFAGATAHAISASNSFVKDLEGNEQIEYTTGFQTEPVVLANSTESNPDALLPVAPDLYSQWDLSAPVFAPLRFTKDTEWGDPEYSESVGNTNGTGSTLDRIDFHFFDNTPTYTAADPAEWYTEIGWCNPGSEASKDNLKDSSYTYCADIIGGARQFDTDSSRRTTGGIRMSTKLNSVPSFRYNTDAEATPDTEFSNEPNNVFTTVVSALFTGSSEPRRPANDPDGLYLGLKLSDLSLTIETTFSFSFNETNGFITDLAGNRLRSTTSKTVDRSTPSFDITLSPINQKEIFIVFVKQIVTDSSKIRFIDNSGNKIPIAEDFLSLLPGCLQIISINSDGSFSPSQDIQIDTAIPAQIIQERTSKNFTAFRLTLTKPVTLENIKNLYVQVKQHSNYPEFSTDPYTSNSNSRVTLIQDKLGNYIGMYSAHALSDFSVGAVNPAYAYSPNMKFEDDYVMNGLYSTGTWAVHDWNVDQQNYGTLPAGHPVTIVANTDDGTEEKLSVPEHVRLYFSPTPQAASISTQINKDLNMRLRVWLPSVTDGIIPALSASNNDNFKSVDSTLLNPNNLTEGLNFDISLEDAKAWESGNQISFLFGLLDSNSEPFRIYSSPYYDIGTNSFNLSLSDSVPLYCLRMHNTSDLSTIDLWSFKIKSITEQRGGVTILNNVINPDKGEKTVVKVNQPVNGKLNVIVMTLDGNIITYLNRGEALAGEHYFTWNGKNKAGTSVARGMYFVRVIGGNFDETRKVMVVK